MASVVDVCNMALNRIGSNATIASLTEDSTESNLCAVWYPQCRDYLLREFPWSFSKRRYALAELAATAGEANGFPGDWAFKYSLPSDCLLIRSIDPAGTRMTRVDLRTPYEVFSDGAATAIYCDLEDAEITYSSQVTDTTLWDPMALSALSCLLGAEIAPALTVSPAVANAARMAYLQIVGAAAARTFGEGNPTLPESEFLAAYV